MNDLHVGSMLVAGNATWVESAENSPGLRGVGNRPYRRSNSARDFFRFVMYVQEVFRRRDRDLLLALRRRRHRDITRELHCRADSLGSSEPKDGEAATFD